jgi:hypothetical protein
MESYKNSLHVFVDVIQKKFVSIHLIYGDYLINRWQHTNYHHLFLYFNTKTEHLPEAICEINVLESSNVSAGTQNKQTFSFKNRKLLRVGNACCFCVFIYIHDLNGGRNNYVT